MSEFENDNSVQNSGGLKREASAFIWETIKIIIVSLAIIIPVRYYLIQPFFVRGASMEPTFENSDYILIDEITYQFRSPKRGEVVVFRSPENSSQFFIKRIVGLPGETVQIKSDRVTIFSSSNTAGILLDESPYLAANQETKGNLSVKLDDNEYFVMGDNRLQSSDSRRWGALGKNMITGKVFVRIWPFSQFKTFQLPEY